jgi:hypothetical protein
MTTASQTAPYGGANQTAFPNSPFTIYYFLFPVLYSPARPSAARPYTCSLSPVPYSLYFLTLSPHFSKMT